MNSKMFRIYLGYIVFFLALIIFMGATFTVTRTTSRLSASYAEVDADACTIYEAGQSGFTEATAVYEISLTDISGNESLGIFTQHQNLSVVIDGETVYTLSLDDNAFGKTPGKQWTFVSLSPADNGKTAYVYITSPFSSKVEKVPSFFLGEKQAIYSAQVVAHIPHYIIALAIFLVGLVLIGIWIYAYQSYKTEPSMLYLGLFALLFSIWFANGLKSTPLLLGSPLLCTYAAYISLMLLVIPFVLYVAEILGRGNDKIRNFLVICSLVQMTVSFVLQALDIKEMRQTLFLVHILYVSVFIWFGVRLHQRIKLVGLNRASKLHMGGVFLLLIAMVIDVIRYYLVDGATLLCMAGAILIYVFAMGANGALDAYRIIQQGKLVETYEKLVYKDSLTGLFNRTAYEKTMNDISFKNSTAGIFMFDLNDLKKCNDTFGHEQGDMYITSSASIISDAFADIAKVYRIGGDEFCAIVPEEKLHLFDDAIKFMNEAIAAFNKSPGDFKGEMHIAYGYAIYDGSMDAELTDTRNRADANMYRMKFDMKNEADAAAS